MVSGQHTPSAASGHPLGASPTDPVEARAGAFAERYRLVELVGEGANSVIYTADDLTLRRRVAVKILRNDVITDDGFARRFSDEMRTASSLNFPRLLPVYDWGLEPVPYLVTEHVAGGSLADIIAEGRRLTPSQALAVGLEAARALARIHGAGHTWRGLTSSNILFDSQARLFLANFGVAPAIRRSPWFEDDRPAGEAAGAMRDAAADAPTGERVEPSADQPGIALGDAAADEATDRLAEYHREQRSRQTEDRFADVRDLVEVIAACMFGGPDTQDTADPDSRPAQPPRAAGPLLSVLQRAGSEHPDQRLDAAGFADELLSVAELMPRPDPLPIVGTEAEAVSYRAEPVLAASSSLPASHWSSLGGHRAPTPPAIIDDALRRRWPGLLLAAVLVLGGAAGGTWAWLNSRANARIVPDLAGWSASDASTAAVEAGWQPEEVLVREPGTEPDEVVATEPPTGEPLADGETLKVFVSLGEPLVVLDDDLYGYTPDDAADLLTERGLRIGDERHVNDESVPAGLLVGLDVPDGLYEVEVDSEVGVLVSAGPADRIVPSLPDDAIPAAAVEALLALRLEPREVTEYSDEVPEGRAVGFRPPAGATVAAASVVEIVVSLGPEPAPEPVEGEGEGGEEEGSEAEPADAEPDGTGAEADGSGEGDGS